MKSITAILILIFLVTAPAFADYTIPWYTVDGGGGTSSGGPYTLSGVVGQPDASNTYTAPYELLGGFWVGGPLCIVNLEHFAMFAAHWLDGPCDAGNNWCGGADLNQVNDVTIEDLTILTGYWLDICPFGWPL